MLILRRLLFAALFTACVRRALPPVQVPPDDGRFVIRFAPGTAAPSYDAASLRERIARLTPADFTVTLRADAIERFVSGSAPATCVLLRLTTAGAARLRDDAASHRREGAATRLLADDLDASTFVVELDGRRLIEGQVWPALGAAAFDTPAMHPSDLPAPSRLLLSPSQGMWTRLGAGGRSPIDHNALRIYFGSRGVFEEQPHCEAP